MLTWLLVSVGLILPILYDHVPHFKLKFRMSVYYLWLTVASFIMIPLSLLHPGSVENARLGSLLMLPLSSLLGLTWVVEGETELLKSQEACVIVANHQSSIDLLGMFHIWSRLRRVTAIAKRSLQFYGSFGLTAYLCGTVFVDRRNPQEATIRLDKVGHSLKEDDVKLWVFPEGTRNSDKHILMLPFKKGAFHVAQKADLPILPIVISRHKFLNESIGMFQHGIGKITVLPLVLPGNKEIDDLVAEVREVMVDSLLSPS